MHQPVGLYLPSFSGFAPADVHVVPVPSADTMAATAALDKELASAREPIPVRREHDSVSKGLTNAIDRAAPVRRGKLP